MFRVWNGWKLRCMRYESCHKHRLNLSCTLKTMRWGRGKHTYTRGMDTRGHRCVSILVIDICALARSQHTSFPWFWQLYSHSLPHSPKISEHTHKKKKKTPKTRCRRAIRAHSFSLLAFAITEHQFTENLAAHTHIGLALWSGDDGVSGGIWYLLA